MWLLESCRSDPFPQKVIFRQTFCPKEQCRDMLNGPCHQLINASETRHHSCWSQLDFCGTRECDVWNEVIVIYVEQNK